MKKIYKQPNIQNYNSTTNIAPFAAAAALVGGYAVGRAVKSAFDVRADSSKNKSLRKVTYCYE